MTVAPIITLPYVAPVVPPVKPNEGPGKLLKIMRRVTLYMPPRSTCHHPEPSHGNDTMLPPIWSITMIPSLPMLCKRVEWEVGCTEIHRKYERRLQNS